MSDEAGAAKDTSDGDKVAVLAQLETADNRPFTVVHLHRGRRWQRLLSQAKGKQRYRLAGGEAVARPGVRFAVVGDSEGSSLVTCFEGRVEVRGARDQRLSLEPHEAALVSPTGDITALASLAAAKLGGDRSVEVHELVEAATRALLSAASPADEPAAASPGARRKVKKSAAAAAVATAGATAGVSDGAEAVSASTAAEARGGDDDDELEPFPEGGRRGPVFAIGAGLALLAVVALALLLPRDDGDDFAQTTSTTVAATTSSAPAVATSEAPTTAAPTTERTPTTEAAPSTTSAPSTTIAPPTASVQPKSCVQRGETITYTAGLTNTSEVQATYEVRVSFVDQTGREVATATATISDLDPGQSRDWSATGDVPGDLRDTGASCAVSSVSGRPS